MSESNPNDQPAPGQTIDTPTPQTTQGPLPQLPIAPLPGGLSMFLLNPTPPTHQDELEETEENTTKRKRDGGDESGEKVSRGSGADATPNPRSEDERLVKKAALIVRLTKERLEQDLPPRIKELKAAATAHRILEKYGESGLTGEQLAFVVKDLQTLPVAQANIEKATQDLSQGLVLGQKKAEAALRAHRWLAARDATGLTPEQVAECEDNLVVADVMKKLASGQQAQISPEDAQRARGFNVRKNHTAFEDDVGAKLHNIVQEDMKRRVQAQALQFGKGLQASIGTFNFDPAGKPLNPPARWGQNHVHRLHGSPGGLAGGPWFAASPLEVADYDEGKGLRRVVFTNNPQDGIWYTSTHGYDKLERIG